MYKNNIELWITYRSRVYSFWMKRSHVSFAVSFKSGMNIDLCANSTSNLF